MHSGGPHAPSSSFQAMSTLTDKPTDLFSPLSCQENSTSAAAHQLQVVRNVPACNGSVESLSIVMQTQTPLSVGQRDSVSQKSPSQTSQLRVKVYQPGTTYKSPTAQVPYLPPPPLRTSPSSSSSTLVAPPAAPVTPQPPPSQSFAHRKRSAFCQNSNSDYGRTCVPPVTSSGTTDVKRKMSEECSYALKEDNHFLNMEPDVENQNDAVRVKFLQKQGFEGEHPRCRWTNREKYLLSISCILFVACIAFVVVAYTRDMQQNVHHYGYCLSAKCVNTAAQLMAAMDTSADPCQDFFQYACGQWNKHNVIPEDKHSYNTFEKLHDELQIVLKSLLEEDVHQYDSNSTIKAKTLYNSCLNLTQINIIGDQPLRTVTAQLGGWPIITPNWDKSSFVLEDILADIRLTYNAAILIGSWVGADDKNSTSNIIQLDQPGLGMPSREYYLKGKSESEYVQAYLNFMRGVVRLLGAQDNVTVERQLDELLDFETKLANVTKPQAERHDTGALYNKMTIRQLQDLVPQLNWLRYLNRAVSPILTLDEEIVVFAIEYLQDMTTIIQQTDSRTIANYLVWRVVMMLTPELTENYQEVNSKYKMVLHGVKRDKLRWKKCVEYANDQMGLAVGAMFVRENFRWQSKQTAMEMIRDIREAFNELLDENVWMDEATKSVAREKANAMNARIGYPDFITDREQLDEKYKELSFDEEHYFNNVLTMKRYEAQRTMLRLGKSVDKDLWEQEPAVVNAFYNPNSNDIVFPAGILQPLFYSEHFPKSLNYGGIGVVIGHEITHGFDDKGRQYDLEGNLKQWWDNQTIEAFRERAQCIVDQYSGFKLEQTGLFVNGKNTQGENIADNGGLKQAYRAYQKWVTSHGEEAKLPGVGLSHDQLFFLNYAQIWCGKMRDEEALHGIRTSVHSPGPIRVLGPLSNSVDFARAYGCPLGSRMNPERKCSVW